MEGVHIFPSFSKGNSGENQVVRSFSGSPLEELVVARDPTYPKMEEGSRHEAEVKYVVDHMKDTLEGIVNRLFGKVQMRWNSEFFPFTDPSLELEIFYQNKWLEVLGCGVVHHQILRNCNLFPRKGWAFGLGLERLAMILFEIPDIRLFWSEDPRFLKQFDGGRHVKFQAYSKYPPCTKDIAFWIGPKFHPNEFFDVVRETAGTMVEDVVLLDKFVNPKNNKVSMCYRINYRSMDRNLTNAEIDSIQEQVRNNVTAQLGVELR